MHLYLLNKCIDAFIKVSYYFNYFDIAFLYIVFFCNPYFICISIIHFLLFYYFSFLLSLYYSSIISFYSSIILFFLYLYIILLLFCSIILFFLLSLYYSYKRQLFEGFEYNLNKWINAISFLFRKIVPYIISRHP